MQVFSLKSSIYICTIKNEEIMTITELKNKGVKKVIINGFIEDIDYALTLSNLRYLGEEKSNDGYSYIECFEKI